MECFDSILIQVPPIRPIIPVYETIRSTSSGPDIPADTWLAVLVQRVGVLVLPRLTLHCQTGTVPGGYARVSHPETTLKPDVGIPPFNGA